MQTKSDSSATQPQASKIAETANASMAKSLLDLEYNGVDRNAWIFGFNPQQELWNGRLAMIGFVAYLLWDIGGFSVLRDVLHFVR